MPVYAVHYIYDERSDARDIHRPAHRAYLQSLSDSGVILARGPYVDEGTPGALILMRTESAEAAVEHLDTDPFWTEGLIVDRAVREWNPLGPPFGE